MVEQLTELDPRLLHAAIAALVGALVFAVRETAPGTWARLPRRWQALPAVLVGALLSGTATNGELVEIVLNALVGGLDGLVAVGAHHAGKRLARGDDA